MANLNDKMADIRNKIISEGVVSNRKYFGFLTLDQ